MPVPSSIVRYWYKIHMNQWVVFFLLFFLGALCGQPATADDRTYMRVASGDTFSGSFERSANLAAALTAPGTCRAGRACAGFVLAVDAEPSASADAALRKLRAGVVDAALVPADYAFAVYQGQVRGAQADRSLRAVAALNPQPVYFAVRAGLELSGIFQLGGLALSFGSQQSDQAASLRRLLENVGVMPESYRLLNISNRDVQYDRLLKGRLDVLAYTAREPDAQLVNAMIAGQASLLAPSKSELQRLMSRFPYMRAVDAPSGAATLYRTIELSDVLIVRADLPADDVTHLLKRLSLADPAQSGYSRERAQLALPVPLHPAADAFYKTPLPPPPQETIIHALPPKP